VENNQTNSNGDASKAQQPAAENAPAEKAPAETAPAEKPADDKSAKLQPLRSVHTQSFAQILDQLGISIVVTTYQAGRVVLLRAEAGPNGPVVNTHFRGFVKPMGMAYERGRLALGTSAEVWEFHNLPAVAKKLDKPDSPNRHDAAYLARVAHVTGNIQIHEMAWVPLVPPARGPSELFFINTRFSCLATRSDTFNFIPKWKPKFITALAPEDRCHLNGMALRDNKIRYLSALGETNEPGGWRKNKRAGGILMDLASDQIIARGLSMPHSPRWYDNRLWLLESGNGGIGLVDTATGKYQDVCRVPGFTRGFDFAGPYTFVGLSQIRESATFSGIAIAEMPQEERCCGVWVVDLRNGQVIGFVKFLDAVQEIFAVQVLRNQRWPDIVSEDQATIADSFELHESVLQMVPPELVQKSQRGSA
jgi:uncharacterized protein (TIGR03032 family)